VLESLQLRDFRCFEQADLPLSGEDAIFVGQNAQGKTSILESVCVLLRLQSPRATSMREMAKFESESGGFFVGGTWAGRDLKFGFGGRLKRLSADGEVVKRPSHYLARSGRVVWMGNHDVQLVRGRGDGRRRYLDFIASQLFPEYLVALRSYERAVRARNNLLKDYPVAWDQVDAYTELLVRHGEMITSRRAELVDRLRPRVSEAGSHLSGKLERQEIAYSPSAQPDSLAAVLEESREADSRRGQTTVGPHRDELQLEVDGRSAARFGSEGQQRSFALALKLAQARLLADQDGGERPILLIDDVFGELDVARRNALLDYLPKDSQKLITTTHIDWAERDGLPGRCFEVSGGGVTEQSDAP